MADRKSLLSETVQPGHGFAGRVKVGDVLRITDLEGKQVADFCSFRNEDPTNHCDVVYSTAFAEKWKLTLGDQLLDKRLSPLWTIVEDTCGVHYSGGSFCSRDFNLAMDVEQHGCRDTLEEQLALQSLPAHTLNSASCFNVFMNWPYREDGSWEIQEPNSAPGDYIELRAEADILWVVSVCQFPGSCNGGRPSPLKFEVFESERRSDPN